MEKPMGYVVFSSADSKQSPPSTVDVYKRTSPANSHTKRHMVDVDVVLQEPQPLVPPEEPPIDYTLRIPKKNDEKNLRPSLRTLYQEDVEPSRHIHDVVHSSASASTQQTIDETTEVLDALDSVLEDQLRPSPSFEQLRQKVENMHIPFRQYPPGFDYNDEDLIVEEHHNSDLSLEERMRRLAESPPTRTAPVLRPLVLEDLKEMEHSGQSAKQLNINRKSTVDAIRLEVEQRCMEARQLYTEDYFLPQTPAYERKTSAPMPLWKRRLVARRMATQAINEYEQRAWDEFDAWRRQFQPSYTTQQQSHFDHSRPRLS